MGELKLSADLCNHSLCLLLDSLRNWLTFLMERAPPAVFLLLAAGPCLSGLYTVQGHINISTFIWGLVGELVRRREDGGKREDRGKREDGGKREDRGKRQDWKEDGEKGRGGEVVRG